MLLLLLPLPAHAESLADDITQLVSGLDTAALDAALVSGDPFSASGGFRETVAAIARGEVMLDADAILHLIGTTLLSSVRKSLWRLTRLIAPAMVWSILRRLSGKASEAGLVVCQLWVCVFLAQDLTEHIALCTRSVQRMSDGMQGLLPLLLAFSGETEYTWFNETRTISSIFA